MRLFVTGATGYIGGVVVEQAIAEGHTVYGLSRSEQGDAKLKALGATPVRGELSSLDILRQQSAEADAVLHLGYIHDFTMDYNEVLKTDANAVNAIAEALRGTDKPFVTSSGTALVEQDPNGNETTEDSPPAKNPILPRIRAEQHALSLAKDGVKVSVIRLPRYVYGRNGSFFVPMLIQTAAKLGESLYIGEGKTHNTEVHVDDAAALYLLAAKHAKAGDVFNGSGSNTTLHKELAEAVGDALGVPTRSVNREEAVEKWGEFLTRFVDYSDRSSNRKAVEQLGWKPQGTDLLTDVRSGSYLALAATLKAK